MKIQSLREKLRPAPPDHVYFPSKVLVRKGRRTKEGTHPSWSQTVPPTKGVTATVLHLALCLGLETSVIFVFLQHWVVQYTAGCFHAAKHKKELKDQAHPVAPTWPNKTKGSAHLGWATPYNMVDTKRPLPTLRREPWRARLHLCKKQKNKWYCRETFK